MSDEVVEACARGLGEGASEMLALAPNLASRHVRLTATASIPAKLHQTSPDTPSLNLYLDSGTCV
jgi:hypothetical protein